MANEKNEKGTGAGAGKGTNKNTGAGTNAPATGGAKKSTPQIPVASAAPGTNGNGAGNTAPRTSPAAIASMVGKSIKDLTGGNKKMPTIPGMPKLGGGGRTSNGEKPKLLAIFFVVYAKWTKFYRLIPNGQVKNIFVDGAEQTKENRVCYIVSPDGNVAEQCAWGTIAEWFKTNQNGFVCQLNERGGLTLPQGWGIMPVTDIDEKASTKLASFRRNAELAEHYAALAMRTTDADKKAEYEEAATAYGAADKYDGFACTTPENAQKLADTVRAFMALNPEIHNEFTELEDWSPVFGQDDMQSVPNAAWATTTEGKAAAAAAEAEAAAAAEPATSTDVAAQA